MGRTRLELTPLALTFRRPLVTARARYARREGLLVTLRAGDGAEGQGEAMPLPEFGTESLEACRAALHRFAGAPPGEVPGSPSGLATWLQALDTVPAARHALEEAALVLQARRAGLPLSHWLPLPLGEGRGEGERAKPRAPRLQVPVNALLGGQTPTALAAEGEAAVAQGFRTLKVKVGSQSLAEDVARLQALRGAVGPAIQLRIDANGAWSVDEARRALDALGRVGLELCEQPVAEHDVAGLEALRGHVPCALAADEALASPARAREVLATGAADVLVLKPMVLGGLLPALALAEAAAQRGMESLVTSSLDGEVARGGAAHLAAVLPGAGAPRASGLAVGHLFTNEPAHPYVPVDGAILLPAAPGLGWVRAGAPQT